MSLVKELWDLLAVLKKFWLAPILMVLVILSGLLALATYSTVLSPLIYPLV